MPEVVEVTGSDRHDAIALLARAGFGATVGQLVAYPLASPSGTMLALRTPERVLAAACAVSFGTTGWIGALAVAPELRRRGLGRVICEAAVAWLHGRGAQTVLLYATLEGRALYAGMGFVPQHKATAWRGTAAVRLAAPVRPLTHGDREAVLALDRAATGENRETLLRSLNPLRGWAVPGDDGELRGAALSSPYGRGIAITASDEDAGLALLAGSSPGPAAGVVMVPDGNRAATAALRRWHFARANAPLRMCLGPAPPWRPEQQFGLFNFFWG